MAIALVTGGSRGIERATALLLAKEEYTVAVNYQQNLHAAQEVVNLITQAGGKAFVPRRISATKIRSSQCLQQSISTMNR